MDGNLPVEATSFLQKAGFNALSVHDQKLVGSPDKTLADICKAEGRGIITLDLDFADIRTYPPNGYFWLIVLRLEHQDKMQVIDVLRQLIVKLGDEELIGKLWIVNEQTIHIRS